MKKNLIRNAFRRIYFPFLNNVVINRLWILTGMDKDISKKLMNWRSIHYNEKKSLGENVGFSEHPEIKESREKMHVLLSETATKYLPEGGRILEVGCGTGLFLRPLQNEYHVTGIDLNAPFLEQARRIVPTGDFIAGNYIEINFPALFNMIYLESALQYFMPSELKKLFKKFHDDLLPGGIIILHYPHALSLRDAWYRTLAYICYTPDVIEKNASPYFKILEHHHYTDDRTVKGYDSKHYFFPDGTNRRTDTNLNTYLLIAQRKN